MQKNRVIEKIFQKEKKKIRCIIKNHPKSRNIKISINYDGSCTITKPFWVARKLAESFLLEKFDWIVRKIDEINEASLFSDKNYFEYKEESRRYIQSRVDFLNQYYGFEYNKIFIRDQKSRWGSCSSKKNLNFSYKIFFLPQRLGDYIIVHELCHLREMNHSDNFWRLVAKVFPDYKVLRKELKKIR